MPITALPSPPSTNDPANFASKADVLLASLSTFVTEANATATAMNLNSTTDTSASSVLIGTGAKSFTVSTGKSFQPGMYLVIADTAAPSANSMFGQITSYDTATGALVVSVSTVKGSGTKTAWTISQSSAGGAAAGANSDITSLSGLTSALYATGQCRLAKSGANLLLSPYGGNSLIVNGRSCTIPDAGVALAPTSLLATTLYYIYAVATAGVITSLEASTTGHSADTAAGNKGVEIKTGDSTRSLVGMAYVKTAATFADSITQRFVRSWFNRPAQNVLNAFTANRSTTSGSFTEVNAEIRNEFVCWADDGITSSVQGSANNIVANAYTLTAIGWNGAADAHTSNSTASATGLIQNCSTTGFKTLSEGYNYSTVMGAVSGGTGNWQGGISGVYTSISTKIG